MEHSDKAKANFMRGYNCAQATAAAFASDLGIDEVTILKMTAGFGGGMGGLRETCGAVSAIVLVAGLHAESYNPEDLAAKKALYDLVKRMVHEFSERHGTICCSELLKMASCLPEPDPSERDAEYYAVRPCAGLVASAAEIVSRNLWGESHTAR